MNFKKYLKQQGFTHKGVESRLKVWGLYNGWLEREQILPEQITYNDLMAWMQQLRKKGLAQRTVQHYMGSIRQYYKYLVQNGSLEKNPTDDIEVKGVRRKVTYMLLDPVELHPLYEQYPSGSLKEKRNRAVLGLLVYQGLRSEEAGRLQVTDLKLREGKIEVFGSRKTEGRTLELEPVQVMDLYEYSLQVRGELVKMAPKRKNQKPKQSDQLFTGPGGNLYSFSNLMTGLMKKVKKINPKVTTARQIRASVITAWVRQYNLREVQYRAGHRYISSTESYKQDDMEGLKEEINKYHPLG